MLLLCPTRYLQLPPRFRWLVPTKGDPHCCQLCSPVFVRHQYPRTVPIVTHLSDTLKAGRDKFNHTVDHGCASWWEDFYLIPTSINPWLNWKATYTPKYPPRSLSKFAAVTKTAQIAFAKGNATCGSFSTFVCTLDYFCLWECATVNTQWVCFRKRGAWQCSTRLGDL